MSRPAATPAVEARTRLISALGIRSDMADGRALSSSSYVSATAMTEEACATFCGAGGFRYAAVEYSQECCEWTPFPPNDRDSFSWNCPVQISDVVLREFGIGIGIDIDDAVV